MYPSGVWRGFWQQEFWGRQPMEAFTLHFRAGEVTGSGVDVVGRFLFTGDYDTKTGAIRLVKQYLGKHQVLYVGHPDGEGCIGGTWTVSEGGLTTTGPFLLKPELPRPRGDEPIQEIG